MKDDNGFPLIYGLSSVDGRTPVQIKFNPDNKGMIVDKTVTIGFTPTALSNQTDDDFPVSKGVSSTNADTVLPWYVNPATGGVLVDGL